jgi:hypothetical protein
MPAGTAIDSTFMPSSSPQVAMPQFLGDDDPASLKPESGLMAVYRRICCDCRQSIVSINARPAAIIAMFFVTTSLFE